MSKIAVGDRVTVAEKQLHGNQSLLSSGEVLNIAGDNVHVAMDGEEAPREFKLNQVNSAAEVFGFDNPGPHDTQVIDAIRRR